jgi:hypothetical protein
VASEACTRPLKSPAEEVQPSKNIERLRDILSWPDFMDRPVAGYEKRFPKPPSDSFLAVQLSLTHLALDPERNYRSRRTDYDIAVVYKYDSSDHPIFFLKRVSLEPLLHIRNFWKRHLTNRDEATFYDSFTSLPESRRPKPWTCELTTAPILGKRWLGDYCEEPSICVAIENSVAKADAHLAISI